MNLKILIQSPKLSITQSCQEYKNRRVKFIEKKMTQGLIFVNLN